MTALATRLHEAEALLGLIISSSDMRAKTLVEDLSKDPLARGIITRVTNSVLSSEETTGEPSTTHSRQSSDKRRQQMRRRDVAVLDEDRNLVFTTPNELWMDYINRRLALESQARSVMLGLNPDPHPTSSPPSAVRLLDIHDSPLAAASDAASYSSGRSSTPTTSLDSHDEREMSVCLQDENTHPEPQGTSRAPFGPYPPLNLGTGIAPVKYPTKVSSQSLADMLGLDDSAHPIPWSQMSNAPEAGVAYVKTDDWAAFLNQPDEPPPIDPAQLCPSIHTV